MSEGVQHAWDRGLRAREIIRKNIRTGRTAATTLNAVIRALEDEGYIHTPSADTGSQYRDLMNALENNANSGFSLDCHTVGNTGNSEVASGPSFAAFRSGRGHLMIQPNNLFSFEFLVNTWIPEWGSRLSINFEDNHIVTENGVEWLYPPNERIILIP